MKIFDFLYKDNIGEPPWDYYFLQNLPESEYPKYLAKIFNYRTGEKLPLSSKLRIENGKLKINYEINKKKCKTFNQKIQWVKLYGVTDLMRKCTDKVAVRDYVAEKIGEEYLKPVLQIIGNCSPSTSGRGRGEGIPLAENDVSIYFDQINWEKLPNAFVIKCNHGCKWQYIIKNKEEFLNTPKLVEIVKQNITGWLEQDYSFWGGFEMQYRGIEPKIIIEKLLREDINKNSENIHVYCFNSVPKLLIRLESENNFTSLYDENFNIIDDVLSEGDIKINKPVDNLLKQTFVLSKQLAKDFDFVRVDWLIYKNKPYFEEFTFTPYSGFKSNSIFTVRLDKLGKRSANGI